MVFSCSRISGILVVLEICGAGVGLVDVLEVLRAFFLVPVLVVA